MALAPLDLQNHLQSLAPPGVKRLVVAYSGGVDSHVLLHLLSASRQPLPVLVLHLDHAIHPDSSRWAEHCQKVCDELGLELKQLELENSLGQSGNLEERAREARYRAFCGQMQPGDLLLTAHHQDDQAETLLLQLLRGAGLQGLSAAAAIRPLGPGWLARPMLRYSREQILSYAREQGLQWRDDPSNQDSRFDRNYLRNELIPLLRQRWPAATATMARSAGHLAETRGLLDPLLDQKLFELLVAGGTALQLTPQLTDDDPLLRTLVRHWISLRGHRQPPERRLCEFTRAVRSAEPDRQPVIHWDDVSLRRYRDQLHLVREIPQMAPCRMRWDGTSPLKLPGELGQIRLEQGGEIDPGRLLGRQLEVIAGELVSQFTCQLPGRPAKSLKNLFQELGVPPWERGITPLLLVDGEIGAVGERLVCSCLRGESARSGLKLTWER